MWTGNAMLQCGILRPRGFAFVHVQGVILSARGAQVRRIVGFESPIDALPCSSAHALPVAHQYRRRRPRTALPCATEVLTERLAQFPSPAPRPCCIPGQLCCPGLPVHP